MPIGLLTGVGSGLASALLFYSATRGSPFLSSFLLLLTPLPSLIAGFGWGWLPALIGGVAAAAAMLLIASLPFAVGYFLVLGGPSALSAYLAYLNRSDPAGTGTIQWYPPGRLLAAMSVYGGALPILVLPLLGGSYEVLREPMGEYFRRFSARTASDLNMPPLSEAQVESLTEFLLSVLPAALSAYWLIIFAINLYLAGRIARASDRLGREWPDLASLAYPTAFPLLAVAAFAASFAPGVIGIVGTSFSGALLVAYVIAGLALMHFIARGRAPWLLWLVYGALLLLGPYAALALTLAGLLEPLINLKRRLGAPPPST
ncbi:MAG TPA: DUF2232 domain-containing protein [Hyphomicrobiaceae bacterium]|jgi:Predicted membrane protein (DUF2232)|nr:DUF2232 domain-containing protein [Hyphomicrobiaceae bacterium]